MAGVQWVQEDMDPRIKEVRNWGERQRPGAFEAFGCRVGDVNHLSPPGQPQTCSSSLQILLCV